MQPVSDRWAAAVAGGGARLSMAELTDPASGAVLDRLPVSDGTVDVGLDDAVRRSVTLTVPDEDGRWGPGTELGQAVTAGGVEVTVRSGWTYSDGSSELVACGVYRITQPERDAQGGAAVLKLACQDRASGVQGSTARPVAVPGGGTVVDAVAALVHARMPAVEVTGPAAAPACVPLLYPALSDLWAEARKLAGGMGADAAFDVDGVCRVGPVQGSPAPVRTLDGTVLTGCRTTQPSGGTPNVVIAKTPNGALVGEASAVTAGSGVRVVTITSPGIGDVATARAAAAGYLARLLGGAETVVVELPPDAALDVGDVVIINMPAVGASGLYVISAISLPLAVGDAMQCTCVRWIDPAGLTVSAS